MAMTSATFRDRFPEIARYLDPPDIDQLLATAELHDICAGTVLIASGTTPGGLNFVWGGTLRVQIETEDGPLVVARIGPGQWLGETALLDPLPALVTVIAETDCRLLELRRADWVELDRANPGLSTNLLRAFSNSLVQRLRNSGDLLLDALWNRECTSHPRQRSTDQRFIQAHRLLWEGEEVGP